MNLNYEKNLVNSPLATILISHMINDNYDYTTQKLNSYNFNVYKYKIDKSYNLDEIINNYDNSINLIKKENPNCPIFILACDLSTYIPLKYGSNNKNSFNGAILYSPKFSNNEENVTFEDYFIQNDLYKFSYPSLVINNSFKDIYSDYSKFLFNNILSKDKEFNILNNLNEDNSIEYIYNWIKNRLI